MSNHIWTEKQIKSALRRLGHKQGWLKGCDFRIAYKTEAQDHLNLMKFFVEKEYAFDNLKDDNSPEYRISFNWQNKEKLLAGLQATYYFSSGLLSHPKMLNLPPIEILKTPIRRILVEMRLGRPLTTIDLEIWGDVCINWLAIRQALYHLQNAGKLEIYEPPKMMSKSRIQALLAVAHEIACMYKALEAGWDEIKETSPNKYLNHDELFIGLIVDRSYNDFIISCLRTGDVFTPSADYRHLRVINSFYPLIEQLSKPPLSGEDEHYILGKITEFRRSSRLLKKGLTPAILNSLLGYSYTINSYQKKLLSSSNPDVVKKAQAWGDAERAVMKKTQAMIRQEIEHSKTK